MTKENAHEQIDFLITSINKTLEESLSSKQARNYSKSLKTLVENAKSIKERLSNQPDSPNNLIAQFVSDFVEAIPQKTEEFKKRDSFYFPWTQILIEYMLKFPNTHHVAVNVADSILSETLETINKEISASIHKNSDTYSYMDHIRKNNDLATLSKIYDPSHLNILPLSDHERTLVRQKVALLTSISALKKPTPPPTLTQKSNATSNNEAAASYIMQMVTGNMPDKRDTAQTASDIPSKNTESVTAPSSSSWKKSEKPADNETITKPTIIEQKKSEEPASTSTKNTSKQLPTFTTKALDAVNDLSNKLKIDISDESSNQVKQTWESLLHITDDIYANSENLKPESISKLKEQAQAQTNPIDNLKDSMTALIKDLVTQNPTINPIEIHNIVAEWINNIFKSLGIDVQPLKLKSTSNETVTKHTAEITTSNMKEIKDSTETIPNEPNKKTGPVAAPSTPWKKSNNPHTPTEIERKKTIGQIKFIINEIETYQLLHPENKVFTLLLSSAKELNQESEYSDMSDKLTKFISTYMSPFITDPMYSNPTKTKDIHLNNSFLVGLILKKYIEAFPENHFAGKNIEEQLIDNPNKSSELSKEADQAIKTSSSAASSSMEMKKSDQSQLKPEETLEHPLAPSQKKSPLLEEFSKLTMDRMNTLTDLVGSIDQNTAYEIKYLLDELSKHPQKLNQPVALNNLRNSMIQIGDHLANQHKENPEVYNIFAQKINEYARRDVLKIQDPKKVLLHFLRSNPPETIKNSSDLLKTFNRCAKNTIAFIRKRNYLKTHPEKPSEATLKLEAVLQFDNLLHTDNERHIIEALNSRQAIKIDNQEITITTRNLNDIQTQLDNQNKRYTYDLGRTHEGLKMLGLSDHQINEMPESSQAKLEAFAFHTEADIQSKLLYYIGNGEEITEDNNPATLLKRISPAIKTHFQSMNNPEYKNILDCLQKLNTISIKPNQTAQLTSIKEKLTDLLLSDETDKITKSLAYLNQAFENSIPESKGFKGFLNRIASNPARSFSKKIKDNPKDYPYEMLLINEMSRLNELRKNIIDPPKPAFTK